MNKLFNILESNPTVAAIKNDEDLKIVLENDNDVVFILYGDICNITDIINKLKEYNKIAIVHIDLISGLSSKDISVDYIKKHTNADGIISTKPMIIKRAKELGLWTILRFFIFDTISFENISKALKHVTPDMIEVLPGLMPKIIRKINNMVDIPIIVGGLIDEKSDVISALNAGAFAISTSDHKIWKM